MEGHQNGSHNELYEKVGRIEGTLGGLDAKIDRFIETYGPASADTERRLRAVEGEVQRAKGMAAIIGGALGLLASYVKDWFHR